MQKLLTTWARRSLVAAAVISILPVAAQADRETVKPGRIVGLVGDGNATPQDSIHSFAPFSVTVTNPPSPGFDPVNVALGAVPAGSYNHWTATVQWSAISGNPWSSEAFMALSPTPANNALTGVWYASGPPTSGQASNGNPTTLTFNRFMNFPYSGGGDLNFWGIQTFSGSSAQWNNVTITLDEQPLPTAPSSQQTFVGGSVSAPLAPGQIHWYKFSWDGAAPLIIDTLGSMTSGSTLPNDTELGLYSVTGALILTNDDINFAGGVYESQITLDPSFMPAGDYWLAAGGFNTIYGADFNVTSTSPQTGTLVVNGIAIPEPASLGALGLAALAALARRRRSA